MLSARSTSDASESLLGADDVSYAATDSTEESYGHFDARHGDYDDFQLHARYATGQRRQIFATVAATTELVVVIEAVLKPSVAL